MSNSDLILKSLDEIHPNQYCDDCLSIEVHPRQQVNQICHWFEDKGLIKRHIGQCSSCKKHKTVNSVLKKVPISFLKNTPSEDTYDTRPLILQKTHDIDIEKVRTKIVKICRRIWFEKKSETPPTSISVLINILKTEDLIPFHQANMMLTLCNMRNSYVYDSIQLSNEEKVISENVWEIIKN